MEEIQNRKIGDSLKPIIFSGPMVKAILAGSKSQTRRVITQMPSWVEELGQRVGPWFHFYGKHPKEACESSKCAHIEGQSMFTLKCRYGEPASRLWVRETWQTYRANSAAQEAVIKRSLDRFERDEVKDLVAEVSTWPIYGEGERRVLYAADFGAWAYDVDSDLKPWRPSIFMPRWASRITIELTDVRAERLQAISEADMLAEGIDEAYCERLGESAHRTPSPLEAWTHGWDSINAKRGFGWDKNPFVWALTFRRVVDEH